MSVHSNEKQEQLTEREPLRITAAELKRFRAFNEGARWTFAKSVPDVPHEYVIRDQMDEADFWWIVDLIARLGYVERFWNRDWHYIRVDGWRFWITHNRRPTPFMV